MPQDFKIIHHPLFDTAKVEKLYSEKDGVPVKYVCTSALSGENYARDIFYRETPHPEFGNRYFGLFTSTWTGNLMIGSADIIEQADFWMLDCDGEYEYSQHRHDYRRTDYGAIDGGRAYLRVSVSPDTEVAHFKIKNGEFIRCES